MAKGKVVFVVGTAYADPKEKEAFYKWYQGTHIPEVMKSAPGMLGATLYENIDPNDDTPRVLALYEFEDEADLVAEEDAFFQETWTLNVVFNW